MDMQRTSRRQHVVPTPHQPPNLDVQDIHPMFSYISRILRALLLQEGPLYQTNEYRKKVVQQHDLTQEEKISLSELYRNTTTYGEFCEILFGVHQHGNMKKSNFIPNWQLLDIDGDEDVGGAAYHHILSFLRAVVDNQAPLSYVDKIASTITILGLEPHFYSESEVTSWPRLVSLPLSWHGHKIYL